MSESLVPVIDLISKQREENREQFSELRSSNQQVAAAVSQLAQTMAKVEERHARQDDGLRRMGKQIDDHETRIRTIEQKGNSFIGGWKALLLFGSAGVAVVSLIIKVVG